MIQPWLASLTFLLFSLASRLDGEIDRNSPGILAQTTAHGQTRLGQLASSLAGLPLLTALCQLGLGNFQVQNKLISIDGDHITVVD